MKIETKFSPGDKAYCMVGPDIEATIPGLGVLLLTIGQVCVTITDSPGRPGETVFDNYKPQSGREEKYMCVETGIGSGRAFTLGKNIFDNEGDAIDAFQKWKDKYQ